MNLNGKTMAELNGMTQQELEGWVEVDPRLSFPWVNVGAEPDKADVEKWIPRKVRIRWSAQRGWSLAIGRNNLEPFDPKTMTYRNGETLTPDVATKVRELLKERGIDPMQDV